MVPKIRTFSMRLSLTETVYMLLHDSKDLKDFSFDSTLFAPNIDTFKFFFKVWSIIFSDLLFASL